MTLRTLTPLLLAPLLAVGCGGSPATLAEAPPPELEACDGAACVARGNQERDGGDLALAVHLYGQGCDAGVAEACFERAALRQREGLANSAAWHDDLRRACTLDLLQACVADATLYDEEGDAERAAGVYRGLCEGNLAEACVVLARRSKSRLESQAAAAFADLELACTHDVTDACFDIGVVLLGGRFHAQDYGLPSDLPRARQLFTEACVAGHAGGCGNQAVMLATGTGGPEDLATARSLATPRCESGHASSCELLEEITRVEAVRAGQAQAPATAPPADEPPASPPAGPRYTTSMGSLSVNGASFRDIQATCGAFQLMGFFDGVKQRAGRCVRGARTATLTLSVVGGRVVSVEGEADAGSQCAARALRGARLGTATCDLRVTYVD